jgi:hypothetical protein
MPTFADSFEWMAVFDRKRGSIGENPKNENGNIETNKFLTPGAKTKRGNNLKLDM